MKTELDINVIRSQLKPKHKKVVTEETLEEIKKLSENPDYGEEFLDTYLDHLNVLKEVDCRSHDHYLQAVKFFSLTESGNTLTDAYIKVFPERFQARNRHKAKPDKDIIRGEASRYNKTKIVNEIRKVATVPVQLIHRHTFHEAILVQAELMRTAKSEMVRHKAADTLIRELKPAEDQVVNVNVNDGASSVIDQLLQTTEKLAAAEHQRVLAGVPLKEIAGSKIIDASFKEVDE